MSFKYTPNTLKKLEQLYEEARYTIRYEKGTFNSGYCVLEDKRVAVINRFLGVEGRINALIEILPSVPVKEEELSGEMLKWYKQLKGAAGTNSDDNDTDSDTAIQSQIDI